MSVLDPIISQIQLTLLRSEFSAECVYQVLLTPTSRHMEDFVTWVDTSKLKRTVMRYNDEVRCIFF
jgi:hypothetical protein